MLVLTPAAVAVVNDLTTALGRPEGAGLRISPDTAAPEGGLQVEITSRPAEHDQVLDTPSARVFVDPHAASYLDDKVLDANVDDRGAAYFMLGTQSRHPRGPQI
ncbi:iron-sulfur cluster biosynthesis protein [Kibdelosporangium philippinense]|uniref:Iron-sulfur cluster biosynthesis protein n=1 Tax=Kibdelosporangium philippinense TaxID=211113 RepID=A0ABS8ZGT1_9PSEU|nr:iron-sulfur cluster biosynthesis protein [Kibdelosporangium philippinense]MCE7007026.1 iron-sulfur cluster biosynthesis protein [Kibdelosporangium philippinense]